MFRKRTPHLENIKIMRLSKNTDQNYISKGGRIISLKDKPRILNG